MKIYSWSWRLMTVITPLRRLEQKDCHEFKARLSYIVNSGLSLGCRVRETKYQKKSQNTNKLVKTNEQKIQIIKVIRCVKRNMDVGKYKLYDTHTIYVSRW